MHTSQRVDVYLSATAKPVIEQCTGIYFSVYPAIPSASADEPKNVSNSYKYRLPRTEWVFHNRRSSESRIFLTSGKHHRQTGLYGTRKRPHLTIGLRNSGIATEVSTSGINRCSMNSWFVSTAKDRSESLKGIISVTHLVLRTRI